MSKLKIAFLSYRSDPFSGGQGIYLKNLCEALAKRNHDITIFSGKPLPDVPQNIRLIKVETPGYFETFSFRERLKIFKEQNKSRMDYFDFFETCTGTFTEPIFFGERLALNQVFAEEAHTFDIFHDNQSLSNYPKIINKRLVTTLHHPIHVDRDIDLDNEKDFFIRWNHKQDPKANPSFLFSANVNAGSSTYHKNNSYNANDYLKNTFTSSISLNKKWEGTPFNLSTSLNHNQNTNTKIVNLTLPNVAFSMNRIFPFKSKKYGEEIGCAIVLKETMTISEKELIEYASQNLAKFKIPDKFIFCNEIPKGPTGKLQRIGLSKTLGLDDEQL